MGTMNSEFRNFLILFISNTLIIGGIVMFALNIFPILYGELEYRLLKFRNVTYALEADSQETTPQNLFGALFRGEQTFGMTPTNTDFSIVIEKIGVNAPVIKDVSVIDKDEYMQSLHYGVAHAKGTSTPDQNGNTYLFAHSSLNFWELGKYANIFNLIRKLETGDKVNVFYEGKRYEYEVIGKEVVPGFNTHPLTRETLQPILTLQTCDPPGTTLNRLIVTAKLVGVHEHD